MQLIASNPREWGERGEWETEERVIDAEVKR